MGRDNRIYIGPYLRIPDARMNKRDEEYFKVECLTHKGKSSGDGAFCQKCGAQKVKVPYTKPVFDGVEEELYKLFKRGSDEFYDKFFNVTTEFLGEHYDQYQPCYIPQDVEVFEPEEHLGIFGMSELGSMEETHPLLDILANRLRELGVDFEYKRGVLIYSC